MVHVISSPWLIVLSYIWRTVVLHVPIVNKVIVVRDPILYVCQLPLHISLELLV
jgi:hypothetical protein